MLLLIAVMALCSDMRCDNNSTCTDTTGHAVCTCKSGYTGVHCESQILACEESLCSDTTAENCYMIRGELVCACRVGYTGAHCETGDFTLYFQWLNIEKLCIHSQLQIYCFKLQLCNSHRVNTETQILQCHLILFGFMT